MLASKSASSEVNGKVKRCQPINSFENTVTALLVGIIWVHQCREDCQKTHMKQLV